MPKTFLMQDDATEVTRTLDGDGGLIYDKEQITFADAHRLISARSAGVSVCTFSFIMMLVYPIWFEIGMSAGFGKNLKIDFQRDTLLIHGADKDGPWTKFTFREFAHTHEACFTF